MTSLSIFSTTLMRSAAPRVSVRSLVVAVVACLLVTTAVVPAGAQTDAASDEAALEAREVELEAQIAEIQNSLAELDTEQAQLVVDIDLARGAIERAADELELLALERRQPAIVRANVAIERFVNGDPARQAFALEVQALGSTDASQDPLQQQQVFGSIVESAIADLEEIDGEIEEVSASIPNQRAESDAMEIRIDEIAGLRVSLNDELAAAEVEAEEVAAGLEWYRDFAGRSILTGRPADGSVTRPALVVKIDNVGAARPQSGINNADVVYVELVEGGSTRFAAVFHSENVGTIGPIRSMRTTDINLLRPLNSPLFANSGANNYTTQAVNNSPLINVGAISSAGGAYFRNNSRRAPHNLYSTDSALRNSTSAGGSPPQLFTIRRPGTPSTNPGVPSNGVNVSYQNTSVSYSWNGEGWERSQDGGATVDANGVRTAPETVIVRFTPYGTSRADANSPEAITVGSGTAWIFTEGQLIEGTWSKPNADAVTVYTDSEGNPIELLPGRVWVELPRPGGASLR